MQFGESSDIIQYYIMKWKESDTIITLEPDCELDTKKKTYKQVSHSKVLLSPRVYSIEDLISIANTKIRYTNINVDMLWNIMDELKKINKIIGMDSLKQTLLLQIMYYLSNLNDKHNDYLHTILLGEPGCGKTTIAHCIGNLYQKMGILSQNSSFKIAKREDFIGEYLGSTATKTKKLLNSCIGGVLFIDEAYSLGPGQKDKDSFSKEAIDTLNVFLSEHKQDFCCIIAGYEEELQKCFFNVNKGLERRFQWKHKIESYTSLELTHILLQKLHEIKWKINIPISQMDKEIKTNISLFKYMGGDIEKFVTILKMKHSIRVFSLDEKHRKIINQEDFNASIEEFKKNSIKTKDTIPNYIQHLYA